MKKILSYIICGSAMMGAVLTGCQDDFDNPRVEAPVASLKPNMTIMELKQMYWDDATNYIDTIGVKNGVSDGRDYIISGRVISSDEAGNVFKSLVIQDETAALAISINSYNLYLQYRMGQEVVIDLRGMYIGKYNGLVQLGMPEWYEAGNAWEATFMAPEFFADHVQPNGWPNIASIDTLEINTFDQLPTNPTGLCRYQSQLVKFNNVYFQNAGKEQFSEYHSSGVNQNIVDINGSTLPVRTSGYSNFWNQYLPKGNGDVVCLLSYYGSTGWQLLLNDIDGCMNFGNPTIAPGVKDNPYTVNQVVDNIKAGKVSSGWVTGYIVGAVAPEVTEIKSNDDIEWSDDVVLKNTLVIGATPDTHDISQALVLSLPSGTPLRQYGNLVDNPTNYKKKIEVRGTFETYMDTYGIVDNNGKADQFEIEGVNVDDGSAPAGNGTEASPYNVAQVIAKNPQGNADAPDESNVWVTGYIVGWADMSNTYYINAETARFTAPATMATNILLGATPDVKDWSECIGIQLPSGAIRSALNLMDNRGNLGREVSLKGNIAKYSGVPGLRSVSEYKWLSEETGGGGNTGGGDTPVVGDNKADFDTFNDGKSNTMSYSTFSTASGWVATMSQILAGGATATMFVSADTSKLFPCLDGSLEKVGTLTSPTLTGGLRTLAFDYGCPFSESKIGFTVNIKQNGTVVASDKVKVDPVTKATVYHYSHQFDIAGSFVIEIVNDCVSQTATGNKDRIAVWDLSWTNFK